MRKNIQEKPLFEAFLSASRKNLKGNQNSRKKTQTQAKNSFPEFLGAKIKKTF